MRFVLIVSVVILLPLSLAFVSRGDEEPSAIPPAAPPSNGGPLEQPQAAPTFAPPAAFNPYVPAYDPTMTAPQYFAPGPYPQVAIAPGIVAQPGPPIGPGYGSPVPYIPAPIELTAPPIQYVSLWPDAMPGPDGQPIEKPAAKYGEKLFSHVTRVHFSGPSFPANSDGTLGGLGTEENGTTTIYEKFIVRDEPAGDGTVRRIVYPYDKLGKFEQVIKE